MSKFEFLKTYFDAHFSVVEMLLKNGIFRGGIEYKSSDM